MYNEWKAIHIVLFYRALAQTGYEIHEERSGLPGCGEDEMTNLICLNL